MRWPWPPAARKFKVRLVVRRAEGLPQAPDARLAVEVKWKGPKARWKGIRVCRNRTRLEPASAAASVEWDEDFHDVVTLAEASSHRSRKEPSAAAAAFQPWDLCFSVLNDSNKGPKSESILGTASLNLADYTSAAEEETEIILPLSVPSGTTESPPSLHLTLSLVEQILPQQSPDAQRSISTTPLSPSSGDSVPPGKDELSVIRAGLRKVKHIVSIRRSKKANREDDSSDKYVHSDGAEYSCTIDSSDDLDDRQRDDLGSSTFRKSFSYGSLQSVNYAGGLFYAHARIDGEQEDWIYYSNRKSDAGYHAEKESSSTAEEHTSVVIRRKRSILPWRKVKVPKKGEPLLKNKDGEEGGDDIDYDRRILTSCDGSVSGGSNGSANSMESVFGDDNFVVGNWESKEVLSRDGHLKLSTEVFFATIDQRSERAAGESACTALVAVMADWFQANQELMPNRSQFDSLIREGSLEWRKLCENETYRERFPDKHFDLETVLHAKIRPLTVAPNRSFVGFFQPESAEDASGFDFLDGAMSFDNIWEEISQAAEISTEKPTLYVVSWNDHFFVLKVEADAYYIIDTLGERLYEGCDQAYILKFDDSTTIHKVPAEKKEANSDSSTRQKDTSESSSTEEQDSGSDTEESELLVLKGKEACKEYIKSFLAAIPIRELQADIKKGLVMASTAMHHRLQIELHYTEPCPQEIVLPAPSFPAIEEAPFEFSWPDPPPAMEVALTPAVAVV
ncbi:unnamed protein product [Alopecurus aequalis]